MADTQNSSFFHWLMGGALALIGLFVTASLVLINSQALQNVNMTANVPNSAPTIDTVYASTAANGETDNFGSGVVLVSASTKDVHINGHVSDANGYQDITTVSLVFYRSGVTNGSSCTADNNDCYQNASCTLSSGSGNTEDYDCLVSLQFYTDGTDASSQYAAQNWIAQVTVDDGTTTDVDSTKTVEVNTLLSLTIPDIDFGNLTADTSTTADNNAEQTVTQAGNDSGDLEVSMTADGLTCATRGTIPKANVKWSLTDVAYAEGASLTGSAVDTNFALAERTIDGTPKTKIMYWNIATGDSEGACTGTVQMTAIAS
jgi:hypothetical protein